MKKGFKPLSWLVLYYNPNADKIEYYNILKYREDFIKKLKKKCDTKEDFSEKMRREMMYYYWAKCEWELVVEIDKDNRIWLNPWVGCREPENVRIDVTDKEDFDWVDFFDTQSKHYINKDRIKIDVWDQINYRFDDFIDYCWNFHHKWQRNRPVETIGYTDQSGMASATI